MKRMLAVFLLFALTVACVQPESNQEPNVYAEAPASDAVGPQAEEPADEVRIASAEPATPYPMPTEDAVPDAATPAEPTETPSAEYDVQTEILTEMHWTDEVVLRNFTFTVDVDVEAPVSGSFPVYAVEPSPFLRDDTRAEAILNDLIPEVTGRREGGMTKEELENEMNIFLRGDYDDEKGVYIAPGEDEKKEMLPIYSEAIEAAPSADIFTPASNRDVFSASASVAYQTTDGNCWDVTANLNQLTVEKLPRGVIQPERWIIAGTATPDEPKGTTLQNVKITQEEAEQVVSSFLNRVQIGDFAVASIEKARILDAYTFETYAEGWHVECARVAGQCRPFAYKRYRSGNSLRFPDEATSAWPEPETLTMFVDESGIRKLIWMNPMETAEAVTDGAELIPFEEMKGIILQTLHSSLSWAGDQEHGSRLGDGRVTRVILSVCCIPQKDAPGKYCLMPAWFILAGFNASLDSGVQPQAFAVNAVDGTRIELKKGS